MHYKHALEPGVEMWHHLLWNYPGFTGHILVLIMLFIYIPAASQRFRQKWFGVFSSTHKLYALFYFLLWIHAENVVRWTLWPLLWLSLDKFIGRLRSSFTVRLLNATEPVPGTNVLKLSMEVSRFRYRPGQYLCIQCREISESEWHPFTITSAPEDDAVTVHIRTRGDWTSALQKLVMRGNAKMEEEDSDEEDTASVRHTLPLQKTMSFCQMKQRMVTRESVSGVIGAATPSTESTGTQGGLAQHDSIAPSSATQNSKKDPAERKLEQGGAESWNFGGVELLVDGPYGSGSEHAMDYDVVMLVGAGIGVTPFASILRSIMIHAQRDPHAGTLQHTRSGSGSRTRHDFNGYPRQVYFFWSCRDQQEFKWFSWLLNDVDEESKRTEHLSVSINTFITGAVDLDDLLNSEREGSQLQWPGKKSMGRPNWNKIFREVAQEQEGDKPDVGVFLCGPGEVELASACEQYSVRGQKFVFHHESF